MDRPAATELEQWLRAPLASALGERMGHLEASLLSDGSPVADGTTVLLLRDAARQPRAVVLCSAPAAPDMVERAMKRAREAKAILDESTGHVILEPLTEGRVHGLSYAVLPYCRPLGHFRPLWWLRRALLGPLLFDWLRRVTDRTVHEPDTGMVERGFAEPLQHLAAFKQASTHIRDAAEVAVSRLHAGKWTPRPVLMHGDLWKGNVLLHPTAAYDNRPQWRDRLAIVVWAGAENRGYAIYDLVRLAQSFRLSRRQVRVEVEKHCRILRCEPLDAACYLVAALGYIATHLERFPLNRFQEMADSCLTTLEEVHY